MPGLRFACHTLTWGNFYKDYDIRKTLRDVRSAGYSAVEVYEPLGILGSTKEFGNLLNENGLRLASVSCMVRMDEPTMADVDEVRARGEFAAAFGVKALMVCGGWLSPGEERRAEHYERLGEKLEQAAEAVADFGLEMAYHPHLGTIVETIEETDRLLKYTGRTKLCLDIAHLVAAGQDPVEAIERFHRKLIHVHLKDWSMKRRGFVELGRGDVALDIPGVLKALEALGYPGYSVVELDATETTPLESAKVSREYLEGLGYRMGEQVTV